MYTFTSIRKSMSLGFIFFILLFLSLQTVNGQITIDNDDGIWTENFKYNSLNEAKENLIIENCDLNITTGIITLTPQTIPRTYNFNEPDFDHKASVYRSIFFSPIFMMNFPDRHIGSEFDFRAYNGIKSLGGESTSRETSGIFRNIVQEFRFKLEVGPQSIGDIDVYWNGSAENFNNVELYYYKYTSENRLWGSWVSLDSEDTENIIEFSETISSEDASLAVSDDNYFYVCVVARSKNLVQTCSLTVDYIEISSQAEEAWERGPGLVTTKTEIDPLNKEFYWEMLTWNDYIPEETKIRYHLLYEDDGNYKKIPDTYFLSGSNSDGFTSPPVYLNNIPTSGSEAIDKIKIQANITSDTTARTPKLYSWTVTWQKEKNVWQDSFNYPYRISSKDKINILDGSINISSLQGEWPMFGYNSQNTRATDGKGPQSPNPPLKWYSSSTHIVGGGYRNPVIGGDYVYVFNRSNDVLCRFNIQESNSNTPVTQQVLSNIYMNSPTISEDYIIIASGNSGEGGEKNFIRGFDKDLNLEWKYTYDDGFICYYSSPVVYENKVFISSWSGDTKLIPEKNVKNVIALDLEKSSITGDEMLLWEYDLPAGSYSTPAVYNDMVFVGCFKNTGDNFFVLDANGNGDGTTELIWSESLGAISRSSPVIYNDTVFVTSKYLGYIRITALKIYNESSDRILWQKTIDKISIGAEADSTPAVYDGVLYVATPRGTIYAMDTRDGSILWENSEIYQKGILNKGLTGSYLTASPVYADGFLYIGTPEGKIYALDTSNEGAIVWDEETFQSETFANSPILSSAIVSNGMLFISDEQGVLYAFGNYQRIDEEMQGSFTSIPINLPTGNWWGSFNANYTKYSSDSKVEFSILDNDKKYIKDISNGDLLELGNRPNLRTIYLHANLSASNLSDNPMVRYWNVTFTTDTNPPYFIEDSFKPNPDGWLNTATPYCSIDVRDNETGLRLSDSIFTITYDTVDDFDIEDEFNPEYSGDDGDKSSTLIADISNLTISDEIVNISNIEFEIRDFGNNVDIATFNFKQDTTDPTSFIYNESIKSQYTSDSVEIKAKATDPGDDNSASGISKVSLVYRYSSSQTPVFSGDWIEFGISNSKNPTWDFLPVEGGGHYELATIATDVSNNVEEDPKSGDVTFIFDNTPSEIVDDLTGENWFGEIPSISIKFRDDFLLDSIFYRIYEFGSEWILIDSGIFTSVYNSEWDFDSDYWNQMEDGQIYRIEFLISDYLGNNITIDEDGYRIGKDIKPPHSDVDIEEREPDWDLEDPIIISAFVSDEDENDIKSVELLYRYSKDGNFNGTWISYEILTTEPWKWEFYAEEGNGYYEFKTVVEDLAGNVAESSIKPLVINVFPSILVAAMIISFIALIFIFLFMFIKWRKK